MANHKLKISLLFLTLALIAVLIFSRQSGDEIGSQLENEPIKRDTADVAKDTVEEKPKYKANLQDVQKASTELFPIRLDMVNGQEWIKAEIEDYLVLAYVEPPLKSSDVSGIQKVLQKLKFYTGAVDGIYDLDTVEAVKGFQKFYGLEPSGVLDLDDYDLLAEIYEEEARPAVAVGKPVGKVGILVVLDERTLYVLENDKIFYKFPVAIGTIETPSPLGNWKIVSKDSWGGGFGTRWLGINVPYGRYGIHGTNKPWSIGFAESAGCIRMFNRDIEILSKWVTWGTKVYIVGGNFPYNIPWRTIKNGDRGSDVWAVQNRLRELGYYKGKPDGVYGRGSELIVQKFQKEHGLEVTGEVNWTTLQKMGLNLFQ